MKAKSVEEKSDHFLVDDGKGSFRVPKNGLSDGMQAKIRAMAPQNMAKGGKAGDKWSKEFADSVRNARDAGTADIARDPESVTRGLTAALERTGFPQGPAVSLEAGEPVITSTVSDAEPTADNVSYISQDEAQSRMPGLSPWEQTKDFASNVSQTARGAGSDLKSVLINPLGLPNLIAREVHNPNFGSALSSIGSGIKSGAQFLAPHLLSTAEASSPTKPAAPRQPPGALQGPVAPQGRSPAGAGSRPRLPPGSSQSDYAKGMAGEHQREMSALDAQTQAQIAADNAKADVLKNQNTQMADLEVQRQGMAKTYQQTYDNEFQKFRDLTDKYSKAEIDPGRFWASRSTGDKVLAAIGLAMGALGSQDGVNRSVGILNQAIDRDIDAQKANLDAAGKSAGNQQNLLGVMRSNFSDQQQAHNATEATMRQRAIAMLDETALRFSGPEKQAAVAAMKAKLGQDYLQNVQKTEMAAKLSASEAAKNWAQVSAAGSGGGGRPLPASSATVLGGYKSAAKMVDQLSSQWDELASGVGSGVKSAVKGTDAHRYEKSIVPAMSFAIAKATAGERMTDADLVFWRERFPKPSDTATEKKAKIDTIKNILRQKFEGESGALGSAGFNVGGIDAPAEESNVED